MRTRIVVVDSLSSEPTRPGHDPLGHGAACASIIRNICPKADVSAIPVVGETGYGDVDTLVEAIRQATRKRAAVINISLGVTSAQPHDGPLARACHEAAERGTIIVAAADNDGEVSYPATFPWVIGVRSGPVDGDEFHYSPDADIECVAFGGMQRVEWRDGGSALVSGNSFAAPRISGQVALIKSEMPTAGLADVRRQLARRASKIIAHNTVRRCSTVRPVAATRAALYPFTKEMHALVRFRDLLSFTLGGVADPPGRGQVGQDAGEVIGLPAASLPIRARLADTVTDCDLLILGYLRQLGSLRGRDIYRECLTLAINNGLNVFSFEAPSPQLHGDLLKEAASKDLHVISPGLGPRDVAGILEAEISPPVDRPVLGVFGTSSSQGKFTLQLMLRRQFLNLGYSVGQVGTEHHSGLFGMDEVFPIGYDPAIEAPLELLPTLVDRQMRSLCAHRQPDLVLVGAQSGTVPYDLQDPHNNTLSTLAFLTGSQPDACILVVNAIDPDDYIQDTIDGIRSVGQCEVIGLAISDRSKKVREQHGRVWASVEAASEAKVSACLKRLETTFGLPTACIAHEADVELLCSVAIEYFAAGERRDRSCYSKSA